MKSLRSLGSSFSILTFAALVASAGCASDPPPPAATPAASPSAPSPPPPAPATPDESFRKTPPPAGPEAKFTAPNIQEKRLPNGVRVLVVERHELPLVSMALVFDRGVDQDKPGVGGFVGAMLLQGTKTRSALQLSDALDRLGVTANASASYDASLLTLSCLAPSFGEALALGADVVENPAFSKDEIERERSHRLTAIAQQSDRPQTILANTIGETLYPAAHPYASPLLGTAEVVKRIGAVDLVRFHDEAFRPDTLTVAVSGDVKLDDVLAQVTKVFGGWKGKAPKAKEPATPPAPKSGEPRVVLIDRPGASQSHVALALVGAARRTKDYDALMVMNTLLGGEFSSRLNMNLREAHAYTYGAYSGFDLRHGAGPFRAGAAVVREKTAPAVAEILKEVDRIRAEAVSDAELADAKSALVRTLPAEFETTGDIAMTLAQMAVFGLPLDEYATRPARVAAVTAADVKRVAETYLLPGSYRVIVVGDAKVVAEQLGTVGLGPVTVRKADAPAPGKAEKESAKGAAAAKKATP